MHDVPDENKKFTGTAEHIVTVLPKLHLNKQVLSRNIKNIHYFKVGWLTGIHYFKVGWLTGLKIFHEKSNTITYNTKILPPFEWTKLEQRANCICFVYNSLTKMPWLLCAKCKIWRKCRWVKCALYTSLEKKLCLNILKPSQHIKLNYN